MITIDAIRERIIEAIKQSELSQSEIARRLGINHSAIAQYVSGRTLPALDTLANLCKLLDVDTNYILCQD